MPFNLVLVNFSDFTPAAEYRCLLLWYLSKYKTIHMTNNKIEANCIAVVKSYIPNQVLNIPVVKVGNAKC